MSKGSRNRTRDRATYRDNYDAVFGRCGQHPRYRAKRPPQNGCVVCWRLWRERRTR